MVKKKASTPSIALLLSHATVGDKRNSSGCTKKKAINCNDMEVVAIAGDSSGVKGGGDGNMEKEKEKSKQQLEAVSIKFSSNTELLEDGRRNCCQVAQAVANTPSSNTKDGEMCIVDDDEKNVNSSICSCYSQGKDGGRGRSNEPTAFEITPGKKRVKVMVVENESDGDSNVATVDAKQDVETPKAVAVTDDEDCSEGGSAEEGKLKYCKQHGEMTDTYNERKSNRSTIEAAGPAVGMPSVGMPSVPQSKDDVYVGLRQTLGEGEVDNTVTPRKISATAATDSSSASTPATTISAPEIDADHAPSLTLHKLPSSSEDVMRSSPVSSSRSGLSADVMHYELQLEEAVSLFKKVYKERPDKMLGFDEAIDYAIEEQGKKLKNLKDGQQQYCTDNGVVVSGGGSSESSSSFSSFSDVLCPALSSIIQGDRSRLDNLTSMAFQAITVALEYSSSSDKNKSPTAAETLLHSVTETNVVEKIQLLAVRRTYGNPPPKATVTSWEDKTPLACWICEVQCIEALPGMCVVLSCTSFLIPGRDISVVAKWLLLDIATTILGSMFNQTIVRRARADRKKVGDWVKSLCRLLTTLESCPLDDSRVAADKEKVMKCARAIETATQKKRALELAQQRKLQVNVVLKNCGSALTDTDDL